MERDTKNTNLERDEILEDLYEKLSDLFDLEEKGWRVDSAIKEVQEQIHSLVSQSKEKRLKELRQELKDLNEREGMSSTNS
jgi:signal transduction protein with GAF and PtsI domain